MCLGGDDIVLDEGRRATGAETGWRWISIGPVKTAAESGDTRPTLGCVVCSTRTFCGLRTTHVGLVFGAPGGQYPWRCSVGHKEDGGKDKEKDTCNAAHWVICFGGSGQRSQWKSFETIDGCVQTIYSSSGTNGD